MAVITPIPKTQFIGADGSPLVGGKVYTYAAGTTSPQATYTDSAGSTPNTNPIILDSRGEANIWLGEAAYKFKLTDADDVEIWVVDYIAAPTTAVSPVLTGNVTISTNSSSPALKITQTGTGDVLRVQDSTDPDLTPFVITSSGAVGIGTVAPTEALDIDDNGRIQLSSNGTSRTLISADATNSTFDVKDARNCVVKTNGVTRLTIASTGTSTFSSPINVTGNSSITGTFGISGALTVSSGGASITGNSSVSGTLGVSNLLTASNGFTVTAGGASITGNSSVAGTFGASGIISANNGISVSNGLTVATGGAAITGNSTVTGTFTASSTLTASNGLTVSAGGATITGNSSVSGTLTATSFSGPWVNIPAGTAMLFAQTAAPTGWTKSTSHNNKALRVVSGTASSGGSVAFTTAFTSQAVSGTVGSYTLTTADIPSHTHTATVSDPGHFHAVTVGGAAGSGYASLTQSTNTTQNTETKTTGITVSNSSTGGGGGHSHSFTGTAIDLTVQYVDVIIATKD
jgi:hypothetical protein